MDSQLAHRPVHPITFRWALTAISEQCHLLKQQTTDPFGLPVVSALSAKEVKPG